MDGAVQLLDPLALVSRSSENASLHLKCYKWFSPRLGCVCATGVGGGPEDLRRETPGDRFGSCVPSARLCEAASGRREAHGDVLATDSNKRGCEVCRSGQLPRLPW
ncbi:hypothetical protein DQ04_01971090 [Trypanosoma grayi]|uniref:hypothetical protein n=1 Tax=Trypanosoma grayi TaxID=71804 RepID=UPI0004F44287|nr:hypothetical protein DQ04_01971090 [Trypanosoma grayi]KEG12137.1 hypothetical protein DQ04_01971090 [Trypanosoma grayi]